MMRTLFSAALLLTLLSGAAVADEVGERAFPGEGWEAWNTASGDLNRDGIDDYAAILVKPAADGQRAERLVVFLGLRGGAVSKLSASGDFCRVRYHYDLRIENGELRVQGFTSATLNSFTLRFQFHPVLMDLRLVASELQENEREEEGGGRYTRVADYRTGKVTYSRQRGPLRKDSKATIANPPVIRLQDFDCFESEKGVAELRYYIDADFWFKK